MNAVNDTVNDTVSAGLHHRPEIAAQLIESAVSRLGTRREVADRLGVSTEYLRLLSSRKRRMSYALQFTLEQLATRA